MSIMLFSVKLGIVPSGGMGVPGAPFSIVNHLRHLALPTAVLAVVFAASWSRYTREAVADALEEDHAFLELQFLDEMTAFRKALPITNYVESHRAPSERGILKSANQERHSFLR